MLPGRLLRVLRQIDKPSTEGPVMWLFQSNKIDIREVAVNPHYP